MATTYNNLYLDIRQQLRRAGIEEATLEARELVCFGTNKSREDVYKRQSIFLFLVLPTFLTGGLLHFFPDFPMWGRNLIEGVLKVAIFLLYLIFCSKQKMCIRDRPLRVV